MALKLAEEQALREEEEAKEEEANNPMKLLENRTQQSKNEIELLESLEELKDLNRRQQAVDYDTMLLQFDSKLTEREREEKMRELDEEYIKLVMFTTLYIFFLMKRNEFSCIYIKILYNSYNLNIFFIFRTVKFQSNQKRKVVVEEEIIEEIDLKEPNNKHLKVSIPKENKDKIMCTDVNESVAKTVDKTARICNTLKKSENKGTSSMRNLLKNAIRKVEKVNSTQQNIDSIEAKGVEDQSNMKESISKQNQSNNLKNNDNKVVGNGLSLLCSYSSSESDND